jgi:2-iminobutanoate/2-iminopropanoate deaminase
LHFSKKSINFAAQNKFEMDMKEIISTQNAPAAIGAYSQAVVANGMLFASGQLGIDPATGEFAGADFRSQAEQAVKNVAAILEAAGTDASHVVKTTVFLTDMANFAVLNEVYSTLFAAPFPARSAVAVAALPKGGLVEIEILAVL